MPDITISQWFASIARHLRAHARQLEATTAGIDDPLRREINLLRAAVLCDLAAVLERVIDEEARYARSHR